tara:strand:+ start:964 stop:1737 length:774 start_codon:yes stop_codon:yes gene_type:complete
MKAVILAGGMGTRIAEETVHIPKPMVEIGGKPILWHIMKIYSYYGINEFIICCGYKGYVIKEYFSNYYLHMSDITFDIKANKIKVHNERAEPWQVTLVDTGEKTMTGGRLKRLKNYLKDEESFCFTYGDGVSNVDIKKVIQYHNQAKQIATITTVQPVGRFGAVVTEDNIVTQFIEKPRGDGGRVNGGFFVLSPKIFDYIQGDQTVWEEEPMENLSKERQMVAFHHDGFWQSMDTLRDKNYLEELWISGKAPWKVWN